MSSIRVSIPREKTEHAAVPSSTYFYIADVRDCGGGDSGGRRGPARTEPWRDDNDEDDDTARRIRLFCRQTRPMHHARRVRCCHNTCLVVVSRITPSIVPVVRIHAAVPAERVSLVGSQVHPVPFGRRTAVTHAVSAKRANTQSQTPGQSDRRVSSTQGHLLFRVLYGQRRTQFQPVLLVLPRAGNYARYSIEILH